MSFISSRRIRSQRIPIAMNPIPRLFNRVISVWSILLLSSWTILPAKGATNIVLSGENLQTRIDAAAAGDTLVIQSGAYGGAITINKALTLVRTGTTDAQLQGPVSISTAGAVAMSQLHVSDAVNIVGGGLISLQEVRFDSALTATEGKLTMRKSEILGELRLTNTSLTGLRLTNRSSITAVAPAHSNIPIVLSQSQVSGPLEAIGYRLQMGYSHCFSTSITDGEAVCVGVVLRRSGYGNGVRATNSRLEMKNCDVDSNLSGGSNYQLVYMCDFRESEVTLENCLLTSHSYYWNPPHSIASGIYIEGAGSKVKILGCVLTSRRDDGGAQGEEIRVVGAGDVTVQYCSIFNNSVYGVTAHGTLFIDPKLDADRNLAADSPCRNAGPPDAIYNDRDGTRNDIGFTGGPLYNPGNYTNDLPIAFWLNTTPRKLIKGLQSTIRVDAAAVAGH